MNNNPKPSNNEDKIDWVELMRSIWLGRWTVLIISSLFFLLGLLIAFTSKPEYTATCKLLPESQDSNMSELGSLGGLAGLAGFDISGIGSSSVLSPELYPQIVNSTPFLLELIDTPVFFENADTTVSSYIYFKELDKPNLFGLLSEYTIGLPSKIRKLFSSEVGEQKNDGALLRFSLDQWKILDKYKKRISVVIDPEIGTIIISVEMPDPLASARVTDLLVKKLTMRVTDYKTEKTKSNLEFITDRFIEAKNNFELKQEELARFTDKNRNVTNSVFQTEYERLQNELNIAFEVYKGLATQVEQAKIKVKEETPVFTILEPIIVPVEKSNMRRLYVLILTSLAGIVLSVLYIIFKAPLFNLIKDITTQ